MPDVNNDHVLAPDGGMHFPHGISPDGEWTVFNTEQFSPGHAQLGVERISSATARSATSSWHWKPNRPGPPTPGA